MPVTELWTPSMQKMCSANETTLTQASFVGMRCFLSTRCPSPWGSTQTHRQKLYSKLLGAAISYFVYITQKWHKYWQQYRDGLMKPIIRILWYMFYINDRSPLSFSVASLVKNNINKKKITAVTLYCIVCNLKLNSYSAWGWVGVPPLKVCIHKGFSIFSCNESYFHHFN